LPSCSSSRSACCSTLRPRAAAARGDHHPADRAGRQVRGRVRDRPRLQLPIISSLTIAASLAQIGEFSFILAGLGRVLGLLPPEGASLILAGALLSITSIH
jgi:hypothetical protein